MPATPAVVKRSKSVVVSGRMFLYNRKMSTSQTNLVKTEQKEEVAQPSKIAIARLLALNIVELLLSEYTTDEMRKFNFNI